MIPIPPTEERTAPSVTWSERSGNPTAHTERSAPQTSYVERNKEAKDGWVSTRWSTKPSGHILMGGLALPVGGVPVSETDWSEVAATNQYRDANGDIVVPAAHGGSVVPVPQWSERSAPVTSTAEKQIAATTWAKRGS